MGHSKLFKRGTAIVVSLASVLLLGSVFAPTLCRSRETANRVKCASNLKQIGQALQTYADTHGHAYADSVATLGRTEDLVTEAFTCPSSNAEKAASWDALAADGSEKVLSYVYLADGVSSSAPDDAILAMDLPENHDSDGLNLLFGDGHVEFEAYSKRKPPTWFANVQAQIDAHARPVRMNAPTTGPVR